MRGAKFTGSTTLSEIFPQSPNAQHNSFVNGFFFSPAESKDQKSSNIEGKLASQQVCSEM